MLCNYEYFDSWIKFVVDGIKFVLKKFLLNLDDMILDDKIVYILWNILKMLNCNKFKLFKI